MAAPNRPIEDLDARRRRALRTALVMGAVAVLVYAAFLLSGVLAA